MATLSRPCIVCAASLQPVAGAAGIHETVDFMTKCHTSALVLSCSAGDMGRASAYQDLCGSVHAGLDDRNCCQAIMTPSEITPVARRKTSCIFPDRASCVPSPMDSSDRSDKPRTYSGSIMQWRYTCRVLYRGGGRVHGGDVVGM